MSGYFIDPEELPAKDIAPGAQIRVAYGERIMLSFVRIAAGATVPRHSHPHEQGGICLEGTLEFTIAGETQVVRKGQGWMIPGGVPHAVKALDAAAVALDIFYPHRDEYK
jgi:quercetin dioxygenase-like cupin family protein